MADFESGKEIRPLNILPSRVEGQLARRERRDYFAEGRGLHTIPSRPCLNFGGIYHALIERVGDRPVIECQRAADDIPWRVDVDPFERTKAEVADERLHLSRERLPHVRSLLPLQSKEESELVERRSKGEQELGTAEDVQARSG